MSCILVLGCYRSGTSAIAGVLHHLGVNMGKFFDPPSSNNVHGFFEDLEFKNFHTRFDAGELDSNPCLLEDYIKLIKTRENENALWGVKDPLLCTNLNRLVENLHTEHKLILCNRSIDKIAKSLSKGLNEPNEKRFIPLVEFYVQEMKKQASNYQGSILQLEHENTLLDSNKTVNSIADFINKPATLQALAHIKNDRTLPRTRLY